MTPGLDKCSLGLIPDPLHGSHKRIDGDISGNPPRGDPIMGVIPMVDKEGGVAERRLNLVIVRELSQGEPFRPNGLVVINENAQVLLDLLVDSFRLPICLRVVRRGGIAFDAH